MENSDCEKILSLIPLYIDGMVSESEKEKVYLHLNSCQKCKKEFELISALVSTAGEIAEISLPADFHKNLMMKVEAKARSKKAKHHLTLRRIGTGAVAAAVLALSVVTFSNVGNEGNEKNSDQYLLSPSDVSKSPISKEIENSAQTAKTREESEKNNRKDTTLHDVAKENSSADNEKTNINQIFAGNESIKTEDKKDDAQAVLVVETDEDTTYTIATVSAEESEKEKVSEILSCYEKDEIGYKVSDIKKIIKSLKDLGVTVILEESMKVTQDYIIIK